MKKFLPFAALLILALASISFAQVPPPPAPAASPAPRPAMSRAQVRRHLIATEKKLWEAWKNKDGKPFRATLSADSVMIGESGVAGKNDIVQAMESMPCEVASFELTDFKVTFLNSSTVLMSYKGTAVGTCAGTAIPATWASSLYLNRGGRWYAASHQETPAK